MPTRPHKDPCFLNLLEEISQKDANACMIGLNSSSVVEKLRELMIPFFASFVWVTTQDIPFNSKITCASVTLNCFFIAFGQASFNSPAVFIPYCINLFDHCFPIPQISDTCFWYNQYSWPVIRPFKFKKRLSHLNTKRFCLIRAINNATIIV